MSELFDHSLFDLEPRDLRVYETLLLQREAVSIRTVAELAKMNRGTTYEIIKKLLAKGLVGSYFVHNRKVYMAEQPDKLRAYAQARQQGVAAQLTGIEAYVERLRHTQPKSYVEQFTQFYDGEEAIASLLQDVLETVELLEPKSYKVLSSAEVRNHLYARFRSFTKQRIAKGISVQVISNGPLGANAENAQRRSLQSSASPAAYIIIYGDKLAQISLPETGYIQGVVIRDKAIADLQRVLFDQVWQQLPG